MVDFLELNGLTIPIAKGGSASPVITGEKHKRLIDGSPMQDRRYVRKRWEFETIPLEDRVAEGIIGLIMGRGHSFRYGTNLYSGKGLVPHGTPVATIIPNRDQQNQYKTSYLESIGEQEALFAAAGALELDGVTTNELSTDSSNAENAPTGFGSRLSATIAGETSVVLQGSKSLKTTTSTTNQSGFFTDNVTGSVAGKTYTGSCYVYTTEALPLEVFVADSVSATSTQWTSTANRWERVEHTHTTDGAATWVRMGVGHISTTSGKIFYTDCLQLEERATVSPWIVGSRAAYDLHYQGITSLSGNLSFFAWVRPPTTNPSATSTLFVATDGNGNYVDFRRNGSTNEIRLRITNADESGTSAWSYGTSPWDDGWHHVGFTLQARQNGYKRITIFYDGDNVRESTDGSATIYRYPELRGNANDCYIGNNDGAEYWRGPIQDVLVLPYAVEEAYATALYNRTRSLPHLPYIDAQGEFAPTVYDANQAENFEVIGEVTGVRYDGEHDSSGNYRANRVRVSFTLTSVQEV